MMLSMIAEEGDRCKANEGDRGPQGPPTEYHSSTVCRVYACVHTDGDFVSILNYHGVCVYSF